MARCGPRVGITLTSRSGEEITVSQQQEQRGVTRRRLIDSAATGVAVGSLAQAAQAAPRRRRRRSPSQRADVVVVGAGLSGLAAASKAVAAGRSALVLEARDRVGGRTLNHSLGGGKVVELGGEWVGPTQDRVHAVIRELGLSTYPTYVLGNHIYQFEGTRMEYTESGPTGTAPPDPLIVGEIAATVARLDQMAQSVPVQAPWNAP